MKKILVVEDDARIAEALSIRLRAAGYVAPMLSVDEGVARYVERLISTPAASA